MTDVYFNCIAFKGESAVAREPGFLPGRLYTCDGGEALKNKYGKE